MDNHRKTALIFTIIAVLGIFLLSLDFAGAFVYAMLDKRYGEPKEPRIANCGVLEESLNSVQESFDKISRVCSKYLTEEEISSIK